MSRMKDAIKQTIPWSVPLHYFLFKTRRFLTHGWRTAPRDGASLFSLLLRCGRASFGERLLLVRRMLLTSYFVPCPHTEAEMAAVIRSILSTRGDAEGCIVEAGCYKGGSTAKFSLAARMAGRQLVVFDSFQGLPENRELLADGTQQHRPGLWCGTLEEVRGNIRRFGTLEACRFVEGWFDETMPRFGKAILVAFLDVDLAGSTRTCLQHLYPLLVPGGVLYSQDGHLQPVVEVFQDERFWREDVCCERPAIEGLGRRKLLKIVKPGGAVDPPRRIR